MATNPAPVVARRLLSSVLLVVLVAALAPAVAPPASAQTIVDFLDQATKTTVLGRPVTPGPQGTRPAVDVVVPVGSLTQSLLERHPEGTRFGIAGGVHRLSETLRPRTRQQLLGFPGAVISGSRALSGWIRQDSRWYVNGQSQELPVVQAPEGETACDAESPLCNETEEVFVDDVPLRQVASLEEVVDGTFYFDRARDRIYVGTNPAGKTVETTVTAQAIRGGGRDVVVRDLVVEKFGSPAQTAAVHNGWQRGWVVEHNEIRLNHGVGVQMYGGLLRANLIHHNGQLGIGGGGTGLRVEGNEIHHNNTEGYNMYWEAGGTKWVRATGLRVRGNWSHHNRGQGLWTDGDNRDVLYETNFAEDNDMAGIMHELSFEADIRANVARRNGRRVGWYQEGAGILVYNSRDVDVTANVVADNAAGIAVRNDGRAPYEVHNVRVFANHIAMTEGRTGMVDETGQPWLFDSVTFSHNIYVVPSRNGRWFEWDDLLGRTFAQWQAQGHDASAWLVRSFADLGRPVDQQHPVTGPLHDAFTAPDGSPWPDDVWADLSGLSGSVRDVQGGQGRLTTGSLAPYAWVFAEPLGGVRADGEVAVTMIRRDGASEAYVDVWQRADDNAGNPENGYKVEAAWDGTRARLSVYRVTDGKATWLGKLNASPLVGQGVRVRFRVDGATVAAKAWLAGSPEPSGWEVRVQDGAHASGTRRLRVVSGAVPRDVDVRFDDFVDTPL